MYGGDITLIHDTSLPLFPCRGIFQFPVLKCSAYLSHHRTEPLKFLDVGSMDLFRAFLFSLQADPLILLMPGFLSLGIDIKAEIFDQLECGLLCIQVKHLLNKVDNVPVGSAPETVKPLIDLHAWMLIIMERAACHAAPPDLQTIKGRCLLSGNCVLYLLKHIQFYMLLSCTLFFLSLWAS